MSSASVTPRSAPAGASFTGVIRIVAVSMSVSAMPPVLPLSLVAIVRVTLAVALAAGMKIGAEVPER
ncbi:hypothetical protein OPKNFCMD_6828 [Methylobacterium crusticola]|uniref:Uncharacterized protein n=1 Tax=Methylobacterium crusticola TaxID=1697972 RepID=A0ABQ4R8P1_9HYPH|nr:hypothetical protein OPKNFCMD_6828 [Methylobacterium crusticola]